MADSTPAFAPVPLPVLFTTENVRVMSAQRTYPVPQRPDDSNEQKQKKEEEEDSKYWQNSMEGKTTFSSTP
jgi:hypothetical protein